MQHVDEGQLHAYLDGELSGPGDDPRELERHLGACDDCRELMTGVRLLRERGRTLLADPLPVKPPPFEAVVARSRRAKPRAGLAARAKPLAWAASVLVALGAGWLARDLLRDADGPRAEMAALADSATIIATGEDESAEAPATPAAAPAAAGSSTPQPEPRALAMRVPADGAAPVAADAAGAPGAETSPPPADAVAAIAMAPTPAVAPPPAARESAAPTTAAPPPPAGGRAATARMAAPSGFVAEAAGWTPADRARAEERLGAPLPTLAGLPVLSIEMLPADVPTVRVRQSLPGGGVVTLVARRDAAVAAAAPALTDAAAVTRRLGALVVDASAPLSADSLRALVENLR